MKAVGSVRVAAVALLVVASLPLVARAADVKIAVVDLQRALNESEQGKRAKADFKARVDRLEGQLKGQKDELDRLKSELEAKQAVLQDEERRKLGTEYEKKRLDLKGKFEEAQGELAKKDQELTGDIIRGLQATIKQIAEVEGYTLVLETNSAGVVYHVPSIDLTDRVLAAFNGKGR